MYSLLHEYKNWFVFDELSSNDFFSTIPPTLKVVTHRVLREVYGEIFKVVCLIKTLSKSEIHNWSVKSNRLPEMTTDFL